MRIDKFLKVCRVIKRRTVAAEACQNGRVMINEVVAKPSSEVRVGDIVNIKFGDKNLVFEVLKVSNSVKAEEANDMIRYIL